MIIVKRLCFLEIFQRTVLKHSYTVFQTTENSKLENEYKKIIVPKIFFSLLDLN